MSNAAHIARDDRRLHHAAYRVYMWCIDRLDTVEFRELKVIEVALGVGVKPGTAIRALKALCDFGYMEREAKRGKGTAWRYRLFASPRQQRAA
jgi:hypothetical protein